MDWQSLELKQRHSQLLEELSSMDDWKERYSYILDLSSTLKIFPEEFRREEFKVKGCVSQVWLAAQKNSDGSIEYLADSDSLFVKGLAALLVKLFSGLKPQEILSHENNLLMESGLIQNLSPNRVNGAASMYAMFLENARILK